MTIELTPLESGCELTLTHRMAAEWEAYLDRTRAGWSDMLDGLAAAIGAGARP